MVRFQGVANVKYSLYALLGFAVVCLFVFMFVVSFLLYFTGPNADSHHLQYFGQVDDFFGGMLNPVLAFASFIALLYTIRIQSEELRLSTEELKKSASAAEKSALLEERNVEQQKTNIERQFEIAKYQEWMGMARDKLNKINSSVFERIGLNGPFKV